MNKTAKCISLTVDEFRRRAEHTELGRLHLPNGYLCGDPDISTVSFFVTLRDLYQLITQGEVGQAPVDIDDVIAIIAFGSAVGSAVKRTDFYWRKKYFLFGPTVSIPKVRWIVPEDADFVVITRTSTRRESKIKSSWVNDYDITFLRKGGLHIQIGGRQSLLEGVRQGDTVCLSALEQGVPLFTTPEFDALVAEAGIAKKSSRKAYWALESGKLTGWVE